MALEYDSLPREYPRRFLPLETDLADWSQVGPFFDQLQDRGLRSLEGLERWLDDYSELFVAMSEAGTIRYVRMSEQTDRKDYSEDYLAFVERVEPRLKVAQFNLNRRFVGSDLHRLLPPERYLVMEKRIENSVRIFRDENVPLETEEKRLEQKHQTVTGSMSVLYEGRERTIPEMGRYLEMPDRARREESWRLTQARLARDRAGLEDIFDGMVRLRDSISRNAGFENYRDYSFASRERFDYGPEDCFRFHAAVEEQIVPLVRDVQRRRRDEMGLDSIRPWDAIVDPRGRPPLQPFEGTPELERRCELVFSKIDPVFSGWFREMRDLHLLDLESRPGKAPGGYNTELLDVRLPFIFMNSVGRDQDVWTLMHESGHAFHVFEMRDRDLHYLYRSDNTPVEIAELASMSMELLGGEHLVGTFYGEEDAARSRYEHFLSIASLLPWIATIDAFQHWIYTHPDHTREERGDAWEETYDRFSPGTSWDGLAEEKRFLWHRQLHLFQTPFYYIEYGIAQLGALGVWSRYLADPGEAVRDYRAALALGGSKPLPELFGRAGLPWNFGSGPVESSGRALRRILLP
ncbi:MAG: M3 family oligoendopeptidase [Nitrososphaerales archaeon]|jgi:oligoendopeptidase F